MKKSFWELVKAYERVLLRRELRECKGDLAEVCRRLQISRPTLTNKLTQHGLLERR